jgi:hypothetical protein
MDRKMSDSAAVKGPGDDRGPGHIVVIVVDDAKHKVRAGRWKVSELKAAVAVDPAKVLAEITPQGLKDLEDGDHIEVREGQRFMSHVRTGAAS